MTRIAVDVPDSILADAKNDELKRLRSSVKRQAARIVKLERELAAGKEIVSAARNLKLYAQDQFGLYDDPWDDG